MNKLGELQVKAINMFLTRLILIIPSLENNEKLLPLL